jgi:hypothetical protein
MQQCKLDFLPLGKKYSPTISFGSDSEDEDRGDSVNELSNELHVYPSVFVVLLLNWIFSKLHGTLIVTPEGGWMLFLEYKL